MIKKANCMIMIPFWKYLKNADLFLPYPNAHKLKNDILNKVWGYEKNVSTNVVEVYIRYLRNKLVGINIETIRGIGYRLVWKKINLFVFN